MAALEAAKQECQTDLTEMQEQLETAQTAVDAAEQRVQKAELTYQKQSQKLNKLAPHHRRFGKPVGAILPAAGGMGARSSHV